LRVEQNLSALDTSAATTRICFGMRVLVLTGAGVSAESGIPTFRGKGSRVEQGHGYSRLAHTRGDAPKAIVFAHVLIVDLFRSARQRARGRRAGNQRR